MKRDPDQLWWPSHDSIQHLEDFGIDALEDRTPWEELDLDELAWSPPRPTLRTSPLEFEPGSDASPLFLVPAEPDDTYAQEWVEDQRRRNEEAKPPMQRYNIQSIQVMGRRWPITICPMCEQFVKRRQYAQHWMFCKDDILEEV